MSSKTKLLLLPVSLLLLSAVVAAGSFSISSQSDWNKGTFNGTSADRANNSGTLGLGYINGTKSGQPQNDSLNNNSLVGYWRLDEGSGGTAYDFSGESNSGTTQNGVTQGADGTYETTAYSFSSNEDEYVDVGDPNILDGTHLQDSVAMAGWIKPDSYILSNGDGGRWLTKDGNDAGDYVAKIDDTDSDGTEGNPYCGFGDAGSVSAGSIEVSADTWHHMACVYDGSQVEVYINGTLENSASASGNIGDSCDNCPVGIGANAGINDRHFVGEIDEVMIWDQAISASTVEKIYLEGGEGKFEGNYTSQKIENSEKKSWDKLEVDVASLPSDTSVSANVTALDSSGSQVGSQVIDLNSGLNNYTLSVTNSEDAQIVFNGTSTNPSKSWEISSSTLYYSTASSSSGSLNVTLDSPSDGASENSPVTFEYTPECHASGCKKAELYFNKSENLTKGWYRDSNSGWDQGSFNGAQREGGSLKLKEAMQVDSGYFQGPSSNGDKNVTGVGFNPDVIEFKITDTNENFDTETTYSGEEWGWGHGFADCTQSPCNQLALSVGSGSASTNGQVTSGSDSYSVYQVVTPNDGSGVNGYIKGNVTSTHGDGFNVNFDATQQQQYITYKAYKFNDDFDVDVGSFSTPTSTGTQSITTGFQPNFVNFKATPRLTSLTGEQSDSNDNGWTHGWAAERNNNIEQATMAVSMYSGNIDDHVFAAYGNESLRVLEAESKGSVTGTISASMQSFDSNGFTLDYNKVEDGQVAIYMALNAPAKPEIGNTTTAQSTGTQTVSTDVNPDHVSLIASNTIPSMNNQDVSGSNNNNNHHGWMFGSGTASDQRAMGFSSNSNSVNGHASGSSSSDALHLLYTDPGGNIAGKDKASISSLDSGSFDLNYGNAVTSSTTDVKYDDVVLTYIAFESDYVGWGSYESEILSDPDATYHWNSTETTNTTPSGTSIDINYSDDGGSTWYDEITEVPPGSQLEYNVTFTGGSSTPEIQSINLTHNKTVETWKSRKTNQSDITNNTQASFSYEFVEEDLPRPVAWNIKVTQTDDATTFASSNKTLTVKPPVKWANAVSSSLDKFVRIFQSDPDGGWSQWQ